MNMKCNYCKIEMEKRHASDEHPYIYKQSGLNNLILTGISVYTCSACHSEAPVIPQVSRLYEVLAEGIIRQNRLLRGDEIRFLRKHAGLPAAKFARLIGVTAEHLSRVENGHTKSFGKGTDRLVRAFTLTAKEGREARETLLRIADDLAEAGKPKKGKVADASYALRPKQGWQRTA
jgi:transcriptional regulator with XRE-family HTH domain